MIRELALFGDSVTAGLGMAGFFNPISSGGQGSWSELLREGLANINGVGPLISSGVIPVWNFAAPSGPIWSRSGTFTALTSSNAYDKQPDGRGATGSHATDIWTFTKPPLYRTPIGFQLYFVDLVGGGDLQYRLDGGSWINFGQTLLGDNKLMTFKVATGFSNTLDVRHFNGTSDVLGCLHGVELVYSNATDGLIVQNHGVNGSALHSMFTSIAGDRIAIIDSVKAGTGSPNLPHPNIGTVAMYVNDIARADVSAWATDLNNLYTRASPLGPVAFMTPYEVTPGTYLLAQQSSYRAQTKTSAVSLGAKGPLDFYDQWSSNGWQGNAAEIAAGLLDDGTHPSQLGNLDMHPRVYWFVRNNLFSVGNAPSVYTAKAKPSVDYPILSSDNFNRANSGLNGSTSGPGTLDPKAWITDAGGQFGINNNQMYTAVGGFTTYYDIGTANYDISVTLSVVDVNGEGIRCRYTDSNNYIQFTGNWNSSWSLTKRVAGSSVGMISGLGFINSAGGTVVRLKVDNDVFSCYIDGTLVGTITDSFNNGVTNVGIYSGSTSHRFDNWTVRATSPATSFAYNGIGKAKSLLSIDSFNRANVSGSVGSTDGSGTLDPQAWTLQQGTSSINSNTYIMGTPATVGSINGAISTLELGIPDVDLSITIPTIGNAAGIVFRFSNTSNYWYYVGDGTIAAKIRKNVAGTVTNMGSTHGTAAAGDVLRVVCIGSSLSFYLNGVFQETVVDSHNSTATKHGLLITSTGGPVHMDNWNASAVSVTAAYSASVPVSV